MQRSKNVEASHHVGSRHQSLVEVVAGIGCRFASRRVVIDHLPKNTTLDSLKQDLSRFGDVEMIGFKVRTKRGEQAEDRKCVWVQFCSIKTAMIAWKQLRREHGSPSLVNFDIENCDWPLKGLLKEQRQLIKEGRDSPEIFRSVKLRGFESPMTIAKTLMPLLRNTPLPIRGEAIQSVKKYKESRTKPEQLVVTFVHPEDAFVFWNTCNTEAQKAGKGKATLLATKPTQSYHHVARAIALGATRTIGIYNVAELEGLTRDNLKDHFSKYGGVYKTQISEQGRCAFVKFNDVVGAMGAIWDIWLNDCTFHPQYDGTMVNFAADLYLGNAPSNAARGSSKPLTSNSVMQDMKRANSIAHASGADAGVNEESPKVTSRDGHAASSRRALGKRERLPPVPEDESVSPTPKRRKTVAQPVFKSPQNPLCVGKSPSRRARADALRRGRKRSNAICQAQPQIAMGNFENTRFTVECKSPSVRGAHSSCA
ncbi:hypothetical protein V5O48_002656 [Marasmius crinis-equi]|uniref:RRM domain-containing protein n=1 Tax=Marasmius crinis-equi TaxID=585013 RepID=A0ABR3FVF3_9AGAR